MNGWLHGLAAAFIGAAAGAVSSGLGVLFVDPDHFNLGTGLIRTIETVGISAVLQGVVTAAAYLRQSPLPESK